MIRVYALDVSDAVQRAAVHVVAARWAVVVAATLTLMLLGLLFRHAGGALACAILGTVMIFGGLILLLTYKGSLPVSRMAARPPFYGLVFLAMVVFGTLEQWILLRRADQRTHDESKKSRPRKGKSKRASRGR